MLVLVPQDLHVPDLGNLPTGTRLRAIVPDADRDPQLADADALVLDPRYRECLVRLLPHLPRLRLVQALNAGVEWVPLLPPGVALCKAGGVHDAPVAEWVIGVILAMQKRLPWFLSQQHRASWDASANLAFGDGPAAEDLGCSTVLIVGHGSIGRALESRLAAFGCTVVGVTRSGRDGTRVATDLPSLLPEADVVILLAPVTEATRGMVDADFLAAMRSGALLVNAARGALVDTDALVEALGGGRVRAALDATEPEPLPPDHPLWRCPGVLITPHVAGSSAFWRQRAAALVGRQLSRLAAGEPLQHIVVQEDPCRSA